MRNTQLRQKKIREGKVRPQFLVLSGIALIIVSLYLFPREVKSFDQIENQLPELPATTLTNYQQFKENPNFQIKTVESFGRSYQYRIGGSGKPLLLLHGMGGTSDFWWQQFLHYQNQFTVIAPTYPPVNTLEELSAGILAILDKEKLTDVTVIGTSLGGYLAQYLVAQNPNQFSKVILSNTFPPNDILLAKNRWQGLALRIAPEWLVWKIYKGGLEKMVIPASNNSPLVALFTLSLAYGEMSQAQLIGRYECVMERFKTVEPKLPTMILEADNDPLVPQEVRQLLITTYSNAKLVTLHQVGHFPYLSNPDLFHEAVDTFIR
ncbi:MAG: alpha/beta hydrolase [Leptonema sp. (in: Bacteria)]|nr:alpha/beta hydrolase [Leptonema sp. (in: bacteria)]